MKKNPFSAGRWVTGAQFFGREDLIQKLLTSEETCDWLIGKRRMGKTSLLREMERRVNEADGQVFALYWDIQGSHDSDGLRDSLYDALEDSQDLYEDFWDRFEYEIDEDLAPPQQLKKLARVLQKESIRFHLLIDEAEELITIGQQNPVLLSKLRRFFQTNRNSQTLVVSTPRLEMLDKTVSMETSPFLHGFTVSYLGNLSEVDSNALLSQGIDDPSAMKSLYEHTHGNPFELQLVGKHYFDKADLESVVLEQEINPTLNLTIEVNFNLLTDDEKALLKEIVCGDPFLEGEKAALSKLTQMGYLKNDGRYRVSSYFQAKWLTANLFSDAELPPAADGVMMTSDHGITILKQLATIYKIFLELAQKHKQARNAENCLRVTQSGDIYLDYTDLQLEDDSDELKPWETAVAACVNIMEHFLPQNHSWVVYRFHEMYQKGAQHYSEKDFLDQMVMIMEEAGLE